MAAPLLYARLVASFPADVAPAAVDAVIALARALGAPLHAVLLEDLAALALAARPSARAFDPRSAGWREVTRSDLEQALDLANAVLSRRLEAARSTGVQAQVAVARGGPGAALGGYAEAGDLLVVTEPAEPMARWTQPFAGVLAAALASPAALLYLPHRGERGIGPIAGVGSGAAAELARQVGQALDAPVIEAEAVDSGKPALRALLPALHARRVRVVVCAREDLGADPRATLQEAGDRRIAVLLAPATANR
jgi:hypothetical protein